MSVSKPGNNGRSLIFEILIRVAERFFSGVPQPPPPWRLLPESFFCPTVTVHIVVCGTASRRVSLTLTEPTPPRFSGSTIHAPPNRPNQPILRLVVFGEGIEVI